MITVDEIINKLKKGELDNPNELSDYVVILSANLYQSHEWESDLHVEYEKKWEEIKNSGEMTDKTADAKARQTEEWRLWQRARNANRAILETIRALKRRQSNMESEYQSGQNY